MIVDESFIWSLISLAPVNKDLGFDATRDYFPTHKFGRSRLTTTLGTRNGLHRIQIAFPYPLAFFHRKNWQKCESRINICVSCITASCTPNIDSKIVESTQHTHSNNIMGFRTSNEQEDTLRRVNCEARPNLGVGNGHVSHRKARSLLTAASRFRLRSTVT
jgi:hypothetical protein